MTGLDTSARYRDAALFVLLPLLFGAAFVAIAVGLEALPPLFFAALRFTVAAAVLFVFVAATYTPRRWLPGSLGDLVGIAAAAVLLVAVPNALLFLGQGSTTPAVASVIYGLNPVLAPVFAWWLLKQRLDRVSALGIGIALAGVVITAQPSPASLTGTDGVGPLLLFVAAAALALGSVALRWAEPRMASLPLTAWAMALGAVLLHAGSYAVGESVPPLESLAPGVVVSVLAVALPSTALAFPIYFGLIGRLGPVRANLVAYVVPVFTALLGWLLLGEGVSTTTAVGFPIIVVGFLVVERWTLREELARLRRARRQPDPVAPVPATEDRIEFPADD